MIVQKKEALVVIKFTNYLYELYEERYLDIELIKNTYEGLKVPNESIVEHDKIKGVFIKDISGIVRFRPVEILARDTQNAIVSEGENGRIKIIKDGKEELVKTLQVFDEIFIDGSQVKEGQLIN